MPRWLRQFTFNKLNEFYQKETEEYEKTSSKSKGNKSTLVDPSGNVNREAWKDVQIPKSTSTAASNKSKVKYK
jgi:hypothetical protein